MSTRLYVLINYIQFFSAALTTDELQRLYRCLPSGRTVQDILNNTSLYRCLPSCRTVQDILNNTSLYRCLPSGRTVQDILNNTTFIPLFTVKPYCTGRTQQHNVYTAVYSLAVLYRTYLTISILEKILVIFYYLTVTSPWFLYANEFINLMLQKKIFCSVFKFICSLKNNVMVYR